MVQVVLNHNMRVFEKMAKNQQARNRVWLPVECEADVEPETETELFLMTRNASCNAYACVSFII